MDINWCWWKNSSYAHHWVCKNEAEVCFACCSFAQKIQLTHNFGKSIPALRIFPLEVVCMFFGLWLNRIVWVFWFVLTPDVKFPKVRWWHGLLVAHRNRIPHFSPHYINHIFEMHPGPQASEVGCFRGILLEAFCFQKSWGPGYKKS